MLNVPSQYHRLQSTKKPLPILPILILIVISSCCLPSTIRAWTLLPIIRQWHTCSSSSSSSSISSSIMSETTFEYYDKSLGSRWKKSKKDNCEGRSNDENDNKKDDDGKYQYINSSIRSMLLLEPTIVLNNDHKDKHSNIDNNNNTVTAVVDRNTLQFRWEELELFISSSSIVTNTIGMNETMTNTTHPHFLPLNSLVNIASICENIVLFSSSSLHHLIDYTNGDKDENNIEKKKKTMIPDHIHGLLRLITTDDNESSLNFQKEDEEYMKRREARIVIATLLTLNLVESSIRKICNFNNGRAPPLSVMIEIIANRSSLHNGKGECEDGEKKVWGRPQILASILRTLLLPTRNGGLNLRNLLWHGFVTTLPERWLALCIVLTLSMDSLSSSSTLKYQQQQHWIKLKENDNNVDINNNNTVALRGVQSLRKHPKMIEMLNHGQSLLQQQSVSFSSTTCSSSSFSLYQMIIQSNLIPKTYNSLLRLALDEYANDYPAIFAAIITPIIEHGLRLWCCDVNNYDDDDNIGKDDRIAGDGYFLTLDGVGQKDRHDVVLLPYFMSSSSSSSASLSNTNTSKTMLRKNQLIGEMGAVTTAYLTDLFTSPSDNVEGGDRGGGPNIRASISHGIWDDYMINELENIGRNRGKVINDDDNNKNTFDNDPMEKKKRKDNDLQDVTYALLASLHLVASEKMKKKKIVALSSSLSSSTTTLYNTNNNDSNNNNRNPLNDNAMIIKHCFPVRITSTYVPIFSNGAKLIRNMNEVLNLIKCLENLIQNHPFLISAIAEGVERKDAGDGNNNNIRDVSRSVAGLYRTHENLMRVRDDILKRFDLNNNDISSLSSSTTTNTITTVSSSSLPLWSVSNVYRENSLNSLVVECGAAETLLSEIGIVIKNFLKEVNDGIGYKLSSQKGQNNYDIKTTNSNTNTTTSMSSRKRKKLKRLCSTGQIVLNFYSHAVFVGMVYIRDHAVEQRKCYQIPSSIAVTPQRNDGTDTTSEPCEESQAKLVLVTLRLVERARMVASTFSSSPHVDRRLNALSTYVSGKDVKAFVRMGKAFLS